MAAVQSGAVSGGLGELVIVDTAYPAGVVGNPAHHDCRGLSGSRLIARRNRVSATYVTHGAELLRTGRGGDFRS
ncbi:hypothetical protein I545_4201 [Mycobacterium kansasii 662]|uniref:Uncharacterized protein n=2 Tax=Mycobacterium kansasii TaxID=1768 RepID=A0A1V3X1L4_MYCKA|nr:hypothetical protein I545_4201 [Mycobacterium kansasii 662]KEP40707.1 hypothetical protein MKSMC1_41740 [Mycobacterium kansasii]OOK72972.1 hypothetical protein BZL29_5072 [Mycobacterium kansasii]OOK76271.1 hypothetical protein BZL30_3433 [Mycobacterium kansasii]